MSRIILDTHVLLWLIDGTDRLGTESRRLADEAVKDDSLLVSAISFWEVAMLAQRGRLELAQPAAIWRQRVLGLGIQEIPMTGGIGILATELEDFPADLADRIIGATALTHGATLITADSRILEWGGQLERHEAAK